MHDKMVVYLRKQLKYFFSVSLYTNEIVGYT